MNLRSALNTLVGLLGVGLLTGHYLSFYTLPGEGLLFAGGLVGLAFPNLSGRRVEPVVVADKDFIHAFQRTEAANEGD